MASTRLKSAGKSNRTAPPLDVERLNGAALARLLKVNRATPSTWAKRGCPRNPDGTFSPCGLIITDYPTRKALLEDFTATNECSACYTISRAMAERPLWWFVRDHLHHLKGRDPEDVGELARARPRDVAVLLLHQMQGRQQGAPALGVPGDLRGDPGTRLLGDHHSRAPFIHS